LLRVNSDRFLNLLQVLQRYLYPSILLSFLWECFLHAFAFLVISTSQIGQFLMTWPILLWRISPSSSSIWETLCLVTPTSLLSSEVFILFRGIFSSRYCCMASLGVPFREYLYCSSVLRVNRSNSLFWFCWGLNGSFVGNVFGVLTMRYIQISCTNGQFCSIIPNIKPNVNYDQYFTLFIDFGIMLKEIFNY